MNELKVISGVSCYEENGVAYLRLEDAARGLGFTQVKNGTEYVRWAVVKGYLKEFHFPSLLGKDEETYIPENIFYRLAMKAKNETAEHFQALVADEIIPSIRKHGAYMTDQKAYDITHNPESLADLLLQAGEQLKQKELIIQDMKPKALFADAVAASNASILVFDLAKILRQNGVKMGGNRLFDWMCEKGYLIKRKGSDWNMPTQRSMEQGLFEIKESTHIHSDGHTVVTRTPKVTGKGQAYFVNKFLEEKQ